MKNINDKTKKWLIIAGGIAISIVLVVMISTQFNKKANIDTEISQQASGVSNVDADKEVEITVPAIKITEQSQPNNGVDTGTEQKIQGDVVEKPSYTEEQLTDPTQKPNGEKVDKVSNPVEHDIAENQQGTYKETDEVKGGTTNSKGQTYLPGFGWIDNSGENQGKVAEDMYENGNKIGEMD